MSRLPLIAIFLGVLGAVALAGFFYFSQKTPQAPDSASSPQADTQGKRYVNQAFGFSFVHPEEVSVTEFADEDGTIVLAQKSGGESFQVFITPLDEPGPITAERIGKDLPNLAIEEPQEVTLGGSPTSTGIPALIFFSTQNDMRTREAWFVWPDDPLRSGNYLYQVTAPEEFDGQLAKIMATFSFE